MIYHRLTLAKKISIYIYIVDENELVLFVLYCLIWTVGDASFYGLGPDLCFFSTTFYKWTLLYQVCCIKILKFKTKEISHKKISQSNLLVQMKINILVHVIAAKLFFNYQRT